MLEWLGESLEEWWDAEEATRVVAGLYRDLHRPAAPRLPDGHALVRGWLADLAALGRKVPAPPRLVAWALRAGRELTASPGTHVVHGDLHYLNVLRRGDDWVAIDPACDVRESPSAALCTLVAAQLSLDADAREPAEAAAPPAAWRPNVAASRAMNLN